MRRLPLTVALVIGTAFAACARTPLEFSSLECGDGEEACGSACVLVGTCGSAGGASAGSSGGTPVGGAGGTSAAKVVCNDVGSFQKTMNTQYDGAFVSVTGSDKQYYVQTNWWDTYDRQTVAVNGLSYTLGNPTRASSGSNMPMGYPSFLIGSYAGHTTKGSNLPKQVSALTQVPTVLSTNANSMGSSDYNASYDVWFTAGSSPLPSSQYSPGSGGAYLMVWLFMPSDRQPRGGAPAHRAQKVGNLPGTWDVWIDNSNPPCISYVSTNPIEKLEFDLNNVIQDAVSNGYGITSSMYLSVIFGGFEVWSEGDGLQLKAFCANVL
jgi:hypothetical protein